MIVYYRIVKRSHSEFTTIPATNGMDFVSASLLAMKMENENKDGEYMVRSMFEKNLKEGRTSSYQSEFDYL